MITLVNVNGFSPNLVCALILWSSALGFADRQISSICDGVIYLGHVHIFISGLITTKYQWIFTKLGVCIDIMDSCFVIANGRILSIFD